MKILYVASEADPFIKTGGLADVAGSLPIAIKATGVDIRVVIPLHDQIKKEYKDKMEKVGEFYVDLDWKHEYAGIYQLTYQDVIYYFIDNQYYFKRERLYGLEDDGERFLFFSKAIVQMVKVIHFRPDIIHSNDWHTAMVNVYLRDFARGDFYYRDIKSVYTIHNLKYQGMFPPSILKLAGLSHFYFNEDALKFYDVVNFMKGGIVFCDALTTVSSTYADEIKYPFFGEGLDGVIMANEYKLSGIVNGIDYSVWNPETDPLIVQNYSKKTIDKKIINKRDLQKLYQLPERDDVPMIGMVSRLVEMKGIDLVRYILEELLHDDVQFVMLGTGVYDYEEMFNYFNWKYPEKMASRVYFNNAESHKIYAGADFLLMPSIAEPCGISQMIAMRYGTIPIVRETGGLKDTVHSYNEYTEDGNGFSFANINAHDLLYTIRRGVYFYQKKEIFSKIIQNAMDAKHDWEESSKKYIKLYKNLIG